MTLKDNCPNYRKNCRNLVNKWLLAIGVLHIRLGLISILFTLWSTFALADPIRDIFEDHFNEIASENKNFAIAVGYAVGNDTPVSFVTGNRYRDGGPVGENAPWHIGSISKSFTAVVILQLVDEGKLDLDTPIGTYISDIAPDMHSDWKSITLRQLLGHKAGLPANVSIWQLMKDSTPNPAKDRIERLQTLWTKPLGENRKNFEYSNVGYVLAGIIAEHITDTSWEQLLCTKVFEPLHLKSAGFGPPTDPEAAWGHKRILGFNKAADPSAPGSDNPSWMAPAGGLHLNMDDLLRWGQTLLTACKSKRPDFLSAEHCQMMRTPDENDYGLGLIIQPLEDHDATFIWHNGSNTMWYAIVGMVPEHDLVIGFATNRIDAKGGDKIVKQLMEDLLGAL